MNIQDLLKEGRGLWGDERRTLPEIIVRLGKILGDLCRYERNAPKDKPFHTEEELKKELGNLIFSTICWCDDLGLDPEACIREAIKAQKVFEK